MDCDPLIHDVLKNAIIGCRRSPEIVFRLQPIDGYDYVQTRLTRPSRTHGSEGAGNNLHMDSARQEQGNQQLQFAIPYQRIATDDGQVQRLQPIDDFKDSVYQGLAPSVV